MDHPVTPDGRYLVVRQRLWRCSNPALSADARERLTRLLMAARRKKSVAMKHGDGEAQESARQEIDAAKVALGERGEVWWTDGAPDLNRHMVHTTPYEDWWHSLDRSEDEQPRNSK